MSQEFEKGDGFQLDRLRSILARVPADRRRHAVDGGAHVGSWTFEMARNFAHVTAFEPDPLTRNALERNLGERALWNVEVSPLALGSAPGTSALAVDDKWQGNSGGVYLTGAPGDGATVVIRPLDEWKIDNLDFLKLDVEGWEHAALAGAVNTIKACRPFVMVELKDRLLARQGRKTSDVIHLMMSLGAKEVARFHADVLFAFE